MWRCRMERLKCHVLLFPPKHLQLLHCFLELSLHHRSGGPPDLRVTWVTICFIFTYVFVFCFPWILFYYCTCCYASWILLGFVSFGIRFSITSSCVPPLPPMRVSIHSLFCILLPFYFNYRVSENLSVCFAHTTVSRMLGCFQISLFLCFLEQSLFLCWCPFSPAPGWFHPPFVQG